MTHTGSLLKGVHSNLFVVRPDAARFPEKPLVLLLHGAFEQHKKLLPWANLWAASFDVALADLPGHGASERPPTAAFDNMVAEVHHLVVRHFGARRIAIVGESLGGLIALAVSNDPPQNLAAVVALDPPLSTAKQWGIQHLMPLILKMKDNASFRKALAREIFGMTSDPQDTVDRQYYQYLENVSVSALVLAGAESLSLRRVTAQGPSCLDDGDRMILRVFHGSRIQLEVIPGTGHSLVLDQPQATFEAARRFVANLPG